MADVIGMENDVKSSSGAAGKFAHITILVLPDEFRHHPLTDFVLQEQHELELSVLGSPLQVHLLEKIVGIAPEHIGRRHMQAQ